MRQAETEFNIKVTKQLQKRMPQAWVIKVQMRSLRAFPDHLILANHRFAVLEGKMNFGDTVNPTRRAKLQAYNIAKAVGCGGYGNWITPATYDQVLKDVEEFLYGG